MSISCLFGRHRPSLSSIRKSGSGFAALCDSCARPLERAQEGRWTASEPLDLVVRQPSV
jgi:hypothetical protein